MKDKYELNLREHDAWERFRCAIDENAQFQEMIHIFYFDNEMERMLKEEKMEYEDAYVEVFVRLLDLDHDLTVKNPVKSASKYKEML